MTRRPGTHRPGEEALRVQDDASRPRAAIFQSANTMIRSSAILEEFEARYAREAWRDLSYPQALARFAALWAEARALRPDVGCDWLDDLEPDFAVARAVNGLPPRA